MAIHQRVISLAARLLLILAHLQVHSVASSPVTRPKLPTTSFAPSPSYNSITGATEVPITNSAEDLKSTTASHVSIFSSEPQLTKCDWHYEEEKRNSLFSNGTHELVFHVMLYVIKPGQRRCYVTRNDLESKLDDTLETDIITGFAFACRDPGTELLFLENEEAEQLSGSSSPGGVGGPETEMNDLNMTQGTQYRFYPRNIQYFQSQNCRIHAKAVWIVGNMTDLRVFTAIGDRALDLAELENGDRYCEGFRNLVSFSIVSDWTLRDNLHYLTRCKGYLDNVVEMEFYNSSLTSFPEELSNTIPNLGSLQIQKNHLTSPVQFPWKPGFTHLPRNLTRTYQFNSQYNYENAFDMQPNLFRKILILSMNNITNLTHFQFSGEFQYISLEQNGLVEISDPVFDNVPGLEFLSLAHNELQNIPEDLFASLRSLKRLDLQGNKLTRLPSDTFRNVLSLETLNLEDNQLEVLQDGLFTSLRELKKVMLKNNNIFAVSDGAFSTLSVKLTSIDLQHNPLKEVPPIVFMLPGLRTANLEHTDIEVLDFAEIDRRTEAYKLTGALKNPTPVNGIDFENIPGSMIHVSLKHSKLRSLVVYNGTEDTDMTFLLIVKHFTIHTEGSQLTCDCSILNVTHLLQKLKSTGRLTGTEPFLADWKCILPDGLSGRPLLGLSDDETHCPVEKDGDNDTSCPSGCRCYYRTSIYNIIVDCRSVGLTALPETVPAGTTELWLQNNKIQSLESRLYLQNTLILNLTSNNIRSLSMHVLSNMSVLTELDLKDNWLSSLPEGVADLEQLEYVRLSGNPFRCDCHTRWMKSWLLANQGLVQDWSDIKCSTDESEGRTFTSVADDDFICKPSASLGELAVPIAVPIWLFILVLAVSVVVFLFRKRIKVCLNIHSGPRSLFPESLSDDALYDVAVVCGFPALVWSLHNVVEPLENDYKCKVFFYSRDSFVGFTLLENVRHCVKNSRRLVVVQGKNWVKDDLLVSAIREALTECRKDIVHFMTVLLHQIEDKDIGYQDIQEYTRRWNCIHTDDKHFTKKLVSHLKSGATGNRENTKHVKAGVPERIVLHDIVAAAETEQDVVSKKDKMEVDRKDFVRQISADSGIIDAKDNAHSRFGQTQNSEPPDYSTAVGLTSNLLNGAQEPEARNGNKKSVFVWCSFPDSVFAHKAIAEPLEKLGHTCILHHGDSLSDSVIQENIVHAVETCTRSIVVLSDRASRDKWVTFAFRVAFGRQRQSRDHRVAIATHDDVDFTKFVEDVQKTVKESVLLYEVDPWFRKRLVKFVEFDGLDIC